MSISLGFRNASYDEANNTKHNYTFYSDLGVDLYDYLVGRQFTIKDLIQTKDGKLTPNSASLNFEFRDEELIKADIMDAALDSDLLVKTPMEEFEIWDLVSALYLSKEIPYTEIIKKGDEVHIADEFNSESHQFATLIVDEIKPAFSPTKIGLEVSLRDKTSIAYEKKFEKDLVYQNLYICNGDEKELSAMHILAKYLPFSDSELDFHDIKTPDGSEYLKLSFLYCQKGTNIIEKIAEVARAGSCSQFKVTNEELIIRSALAVYSNEVYTFDDSNILGEIKEEIIKKTGDTFQVDYDKFWYGENQIVFALIGSSSGATEDDAKIKIEAGASGNFKVKFITDLVKEYNENPEVEFVKANGDSVTIDYTLDIDLSGGTLQINNTLDENVWVKKFIIRGVPLNCQSGNSTKIVGETDENLLLETNGSVQNNETAELFSKWNHYIKCRDWTQLTFDTNVSTWLESGMMVTLDHSRYSDSEITLWIQEITHNPTSANVRAFIYQDFVSTEINFSNEESSAANYDFILTKDYIDNNTLTVNDNVPEKPINFRLESNFKSFEIIAEKPSDQNISGFVAYITDDTGVEQKISYSTTTKTVNAKSGKIYSVQLSCITFKGIESQKTDTLNISAIEDELKEISGLTEIKSNLDNVINNDISNMLTSIDSLTGRTGESEQSIFDIIKTGGALDLVNINLEEITKVGGKLDQTKLAAVSEAKTELEPQITEITKVGGKLDQVKTEAISTVKGDLEPQITDITKTGGKLDQVKTEAISTVKGDLEPQITEITKTGGKLDQVKTEAISTVKDDLEPQIIDITKTGGKLDQVKTEAISTVKGDLEPQITEITKTGGKLDQVKTEAISTVKGDLEPQITEITKTGGKLDQVKTEAISTVKGDLEPQITDITKTGGKLDQTKNAAVSEAKTELEPQILLAKAEIFGDETLGTVGLKKTVFGEDGKGGINASVESLVATVTDDDKGLTAKLDTVEFAIGLDEGVSTKIKSLEYDMNNDKGQLRTASQAITKDYIRNTVGVVAMDFNLEEAEMNDYEFWDSKSFEIDETTKKSWFDGVSLTTSYTMQELTNERFLSEVKRIDKDASVTRSAIEQKADGILMTVSEEVNRINADINGVRGEITTSYNSLINQTSSSIELSVNESKEYAKTYTDGVKTTLDGEIGNKTTLTEAVDEVKSKISIDQDGIDLLGKKITLGDEITIVDNVMKVVNLTADHIASNSITVEKLSIPSESGDISLENNELRVKKISSDTELSIQAKNFSLDGENVVKSLFSMCIDNSDGTFTNVVELSDGSFVYSYYYRGKGTGLYIYKVDSDFQEKEILGKIEVNNSAEELFCHHLAIFNGKIYIFTSKRNVDKSREANIYSISESAPNNTQATFVFQCENKIYNGNITFGHGKMNSVVKNNTLFFTRQSDTLGKHVLQSLNTTNQVSGNLFTTTDGGLITSINSLIPYSPSENKIAFTTDEIMYNRIYTYDILNNVIKLLIRTDENKLCLTEFKGEVYLIQGTSILKGSFEGGSWEIVEEEIPTYGKVKFSCSGNEMIYYTGKLYFLRSFDGKNFEKVYTSEYEIENIDVLNSRTIYSAKNQLFEDYDLKVATALTLSISYKS